MASDFFADLKRNSDTCWLVLVVGKLFAYLRPSFNILLFYSQLQL